MADLKNLSVEEFAAVTGSDAPAPGGGSVAALAGGLGAALAEMVANLTIGKAKYADVEEEMKGLPKGTLLIKIAKKTHLLKPEAPVDSLANANPGKIRA